MLVAEESGTPLFLGEDLVAYLVLAFAGALFVGNVLALLRPPGGGRPGGDGRGGEGEGTDGVAARPPLARSLVMAALGLLGTVWALASLVAG